MYESNAHFYDFFAFKGDDAQAKTSLLCELAQPQSHLLDLGSGTGKIAIELAKKGHKLVCVESSQAMRSVFLTKLADLQLDKQISIFPKELTELNLDQPIDIGFAFDFFLLIKEDSRRKSLIKGLYELIKRNGLLVANFVPTQPYRATKPISENSRRTLGELTYIHSTAAEQLTSTTRKITWRFETYHKDKLLEQMTEYFTIRQDDLKSLCPLFEENGFSIEKVYSDFKFTPYTGRELSFIIVARKA